MCFTNLRLRCYKVLVERARFLKVKVPYIQRSCTLCNSNDIEDEYHVTLVCEYFRNVRKKHSSHSIIRDLIGVKFHAVITSASKKDCLKLMLFLKFVFKMYAETL